MKANESTVDRVIRIVLGVILLAAGITLGGAWGIVLDVIGLLALVTGAIGVCPAYKLFGGFSTKK